MSQNIQYNQEKVIANIKKTIPKIKQVPKWKGWLKTGLYSVLSAIFLVLSTLTWLVFTDQIKANLVFASVVGINFSGWLWLWFPEMSVFSIVFLAITFMVYRVRDLPGYKYFDFACLAIMGIFVISSVFYIITPANALSSNQLISNIKLSANQSSYRLYWRDKHIEDLKNKNEFYGGVSASDGNNISIDHASVILDFKCGTSDCENIKKGDLIWVKFNLLNGNKIIQLFEVLK